MRTPVVLLCLALAACAAPRPNTVKSLACTAEAEGVANEKAWEFAEDSLSAGMTWRGNEEDAYELCMKR